MILEFSKEIYPKSVLIKAAYNFTDIAYIHLSKNEDNYVVEISNKEGKKALSSGEFENEMLAQTARYEVYMQTKEIRKLTLARAMASTLIGNDGDEGNQIEESFQLNDLIKDWFTNDNT